MTSEITKTISGEVVNFYTPREQRIRSLKVYFSPKQAGTGTPNPENVRPISGWTGVEVNHCGKNLFDYANAGIVNGYRNDNGIEATSVNSKYTTTAYPVIPRAVYWLSNMRNDVEDVSFNIYFLDKNKNWIRRSGWVFTTSNYLSFTSLENCYYVQFQFRNTTDVSKMQLELGSLDMYAQTSYTPYEPYKTKISLPKEYQEVEYLESTGTQYIELPFGFDPTDEIETKFSISKDHYIDKYIVSPIQWNTNNNRFGMGVHGGTSSLGAGYYTIAYGNIATSRTKFDPNTLNDGNLHNWQYKNYTFYIADVGRSKSVLSIPFGSTTANLRLFYGYNSNTKGKIASYHHKKANGTEINFIPCYRKSDKVAGMYDAVSGQFYTNSGTGEFITGPEVNPHSIDWTDEVGTVYGGYVDLVSGELVVTSVKRIFNGTEGIIKTTYSGTPFALTVNTNKDKTFGFGRGYSLEEVACNKLQFQTARYNGVGKGCIATNQSSVDSSILFRDTDVLGTTVEEAKAVLAEWYANGEPLEVVGKLRTDCRSTYQLSPAILTSLIQTNTFWSNADRVEVEYEFVNRFNAIESRKSIFTNTPRTESLSGNILSFNTDMAADLKECKIYFSPKQNLHGYSKPWIGGMGKNILNPDSFTITKGNTINYTNGNLNGLTSSSRAYSSYIDCLPNTTYTISGASFGTGANIGTAFYNENKEYISGVPIGNGTSHTFTTPDGAKFFRTSWMNIGDATTNDIQLELGSTATDFEPYENICPIEGWDGISIGRNDGQDFYVYNVRNSNSGSIVTKIDENSFRLSTSRKITYPASRQDSSTLNLSIGKRYFIDFDINIDTLVDEHVCVFGFRNTSNAFQVDARVIIEQSGHYGFDFVYDNNTRLNYLSLCETSGKVVNFDATISNLHIYEAASIVIDFPQTIYGGYIDLVNGEVVEEYNMIDLSTIKWLTNFYPPSRFFAWLLPGYKGVSRNIETFDGYCDTLSVQSMDAASGNSYITMRVSGGNGWIVKTDGTQETVPSGNLCMGLKTPNTYSLTPQNITTLRGANTIYSNSNNVTEITYFKHGDDAYTHIPVSNALSSNDNFILVTDDGYVIGDSNDYIVY